MLERLRSRAEWTFFGILPRADRALALAWWTVLVSRGLLPALFAIVAGGLVGAVQRGEDPAGVIDDLNLHRAFLRFELEAELLLQRGDEVRRICRIGRWWSPSRSVLERKGIAPTQAGAVVDQSSRLTGKRPDQIVERHGSGDDSLTERTATSS